MRTVQELHRAEKKFKAAFEAKIDTLTSLAEITDWLYRYKNADARLKGDEAGVRILRDLGGWNKAKDKQKDAVKKLLSLKTFDKLWFEYEGSTTISAYEFQKHLVCAITKKVLADKSVALVQLGTGTGKSVIVNLAAHAINTMTNDKVIIVTPTFYLRTVGFTKFRNAVKDIDVLSGARLGKNEILHATAEQLLLIPESFIAKSTVVFDEMDACILGQQCSIEVDEETGKQTFLHIAAKLAKAKRIVGLSGTFTD